MNILRDTFPDGVGVQSNSFTQIGVQTRELFLLTSIIYSSANNSVVVQRLHQAWNLQGVKARWKEIGFVTF